MKIVIIGGVAAGMSAASKIKRTKKDAQVLVLEKTNEVSYGACGLPYYISGDNKNENLLRIRRADEFRASGIEVWTDTEATAVDFEKKIVFALRSGSEKIETSYDKLIIATGASPILPQLPGVSNKNVFTLKSIDDANKIKEAAQGKKNVVIVGAGYIGMELVESFTKLGLNVRVVEMAERILPAFDPEITEPLHRYLTEEGIELCVGEKVVEILGDGSVTGVRTDRGTYPADMVIVSIGVRPNTSFLEGKIKTLPNGAVLVDEWMQTSMPDVYAGGDCASSRHRASDKDVYLPLGTVANRQGKLIGEHICGEGRPFPGVLGTAMAKILDIEVGCTGLSENQAKQAGFDISTCFVTAPSHAQYYPNPTPISLKLIYCRKTRVLLGAQIYGKSGAALRTDVLASCIWNKMTVDDMQLMDLGYAPPFAHVWDVIHIAAGAAK